MPDNYVCSLFYTENVKSISAAVAGAHGKAGRIVGNDGFGESIRQMKMELVIQAVAKSDGDWIVVGIADSTSGIEWIRLKKAAGKIGESDLKLASGDMIRPLDVVSADIAKSRSGEDYIWNTAVPAKLVARLEAEQRTRVLNEHARSSVRQLDFKNEPFVLVGPIRPVAEFTKSAAGCKAELTARELMRGKPIRVIDPKWLELGNSFLSKSNEMSLENDYLERALGIHRIFAVVGVEGGNGLTVLCVHTIPDYSTELYFPVV